jgi:hypothetical protein
LRLAEANLDAFWKHVDARIYNLSDEEHHCILKHLLDEGGEMRRTKPWTPRTATAKPLLAEEVCEPKPLSGIFHDPTNRVTDRLKKSHISQKIKVKIRGTPGAREAAPQPVREPSPDQ